MAISPNVNAYQQGSSQPVEPAEQAFTRRFGERAFSLLQANNPELVDLVVTFKTLNTDLDASSAMGVFILQYGEDVRYIPVVMADGALVSCEMLYDKTEDLLMPLSKKATMDMVRSNGFTEATPLRGQVRVEDTHALFRGLNRPPRSSHVVLASAGNGVAGLPDRAKKRLSDYLESHPALLGTIASFYPAEKLAASLAPSETVSAVQPSGFMQLETITADKVKKLTPEEREALLRDGYLTPAGQEPPGKVALGLDNFRSGAETSLGLEEYAPSARPRRPSKHGPVVVSDSGGDDPFFPTPVYSAGLACLHPKPGLEIVPVMVMRGCYFGADGLRGKCDREHPALLAGRSEAVSAEYLLNLGAVSTLEEVASRIKASSEHDYVGVLALCPTRSGGYAAVVPTEFGLYDHTVNGSKDFWKLMDDTLTVKFAPGIQISDHTRYGFLQLSDRLVFPRDSLFFVSNMQSTGHGAAGSVGTFANLLNLLRWRGTELVVSRDGVRVNVTDVKTEKTASFPTDAGAAEWLYPTRRKASPFRAGI
jgi:hypothetical protein